MCKPKIQKQARFCSFIIFLVLVLLYSSLIIILRSSHVFLISCLNKIIMGGSKIKDSSTRVHHNKIKKFKGNRYKKVCNSTESADAPLGKNFHVQPPQRKLINKGILQNPQKMKNLTLL